MEVLRVRGSLQVTKPIALPVRPPTRLTALLVASVALLRAGPADEVTLDSPDEAFDAASEALSLALVAPEEAALAASDVVEALRQGAWRKTHCCRRSTARDADSDMSRGRKGGTKGIGWLERCRFKMPQFHRSSQE